MQRGLTAHFEPRSSAFGDFDGDSVITTADIAMLLLNFGPVTWP